MHLYVQETCLLFSGDMVEILSAVCVTGFNIFNYTLQKNDTLSLVDVLKQECFCGIFL